MAEWVHLSSASALREHIEAPGKARAYAALMRDFGVDPDALGLLSWHPTVIHAEQPGNWFYPEDLARHRLLRALIETGSFSARSGVKTLVKDGFAVDAMKAFFTSFALFELEPRVRLIGAGAHRRHRHRCYDAVPLELVRSRLAAVFDTSAALLDAAGGGVGRFCEVMRAHFERGVEPSLRPLLPADNTRRAFEQLGEQLVTCDTDRACAQLGRARELLDVHEDWASYWRAVNEGFFGSAIAPLEPLFNHMLLAIRDPWRAAASLAALSGAEGPVPLAGIVDEDRRYRLVFADPQRHELHVRAGGERRAVSWAWVREQAEAGRTGGPSVMLCYLMMAAIGIYIVADGGDGELEFERLVDEVHRRYAGLGWPVVALPGPQSAPQAYVGVFLPASARRDRAALQRFMSE